MAKKVRSMSSGLSNAQSLRIPVECGRNKQLRTDGNVRSVKGRLAMRFTPNWALSERQRTAIRQRVKPMVEINNDVVFNTDGTFEIFLDPKLQLNHRERAALAFRDSFSHWLHDNPYSDSDKNDRSSNNGRPDNRDAGRKKTPPGGAFSG